MNITTSTIRVNTDDMFTDEVGEQICDDIEDALTTCQDNINTFLSHKYGMIFKVTSEL